MTLKLSALTICGILISLTSIVLIFVLFRFSKTRIARVWMTFNISLVIYGFCCIYIGLATDAMTGLFWIKLSHIGVIALPPLFFHTVCLLCNLEKRILLIFSYLQALIFINVNLFTNYIYINSSLKFESLYWPNPGIWFTPFFSIYILICFVAFSKLISSYHQSLDDKKRQILFFAASTAVGFSGGLLNFALVYKPLFYPYNNYLIPVYSVLATYAIFKHNLFDINIVLKKSIIYSISVTLISLIYLSLTLITEKLFNIFFSYNSAYLSICIAFTLGIIFIPLRNRIQCFVDKFFFQKSPQDMFDENVKLREEVANTEKLKSVATLASGVAHEIKNPLTAIKTFAEYLPEKLNDKDFLEKFSKIVGNEVDKIDGMVHQLLNFAKPSPLKKKKTNIRKLIDDTCTFLSNKFVKHKVKVEQNFSTHAPIYLNIDANQFRQALMNIFLNAIDAMPGGGNLKVATRVKEQGTRNQKKTRQKSSSSLVPDSSFLITIKDTGQGISPKDLEHIFDPFFTLKDGGTGLGLPLTHGIIEKHGGKITVRSEIGVGTEFLIELPLNR